MSDELREKVVAIIRRGAIYPQTSDELADAAIALVRDATLEEAAVVARGHKANLEECGEYDTGYDDGRDDAAAAIRAMKGKQPTG